MIGEYAYLLHSQPDQWQSIVRYVFNKVLYGEPGRGEEVVSLIIYRIGSQLPSETSQTSGKEYRSKLPSAIEAVLKLDKERTFPSFI